MPHLVFRNIEKDVFVDRVKEFSKKATAIIGCPEDWITLSYIDNSLTYVCGEDQTSNNIFVEVNWFERPKEIKDSLAKLINDSFKKDNSDIIIVFKILDKENYYENGETV